MNCKKQVEKAHYEFNSYMSKERWISVWHQLDEIQKLKPENVLEVGPGPGLFKIIAAAFKQDEKARSPMSVSMVR